MAKKDQVKEEQKKHWLTNFDRISGYESSSETLMALGHHDIIRMLFIWLRFLPFFSFSPQFDGFSSLVCYLF